MNEAKINKAIDQFVLDSIGSTKPGRAAMGRLIATGVPSLLIEWTKGELKRGTPQPEIVVALFQLAPAAAVIALGVMPPEAVAPTAALAKDVFGKVLDKCVEAVTARAGQIDAEIRAEVAKIMRDAGAPEHLIKAALGDL
jgi:hypothetical protein